MPFAWLGPPAAMERPKPSETLYIRDILPSYTRDDITAAFSQLPGYTATRIRTDKNGHPVAFIEFSSVEYASAAKEALDGLLRIRPTDGPVTIHYARPTGAGGDPGPGPVAGSKRPPPASNGDPRAVRPRESRFGQQHQEFFGLSSQSSATNFGGAAPSFGGTGPGLGGAGGPGLPNSSVFVEGIPKDATEREITHLFRPFIGYRSLRFVPRPGKNPMCFVEFETVEQASAALNGLQGYQIDLKDPTDKGVRLEYAKSKTHGGGLGAGVGSGGGAALMGRGTAPGYIPPPSGPAVGPSASLFQGGPPPLHGGGGGYPQQQQQQAPTRFQAQVQPQQQLQQLQDFSKPLSVGGLGGGAMLGQLPQQQQQHQMYSGSATGAVAVNQYGVAGAVNQFGATGTTAQFGATGAAVGQYGTTAMTAAAAANQYLATGAAVGQYGAQPFQQQQLQLQQQQMQQQQQQQQQQQLPGMFMHPQLAKYGPY